MPVYIPPSKGCSNASDSSSGAGNLTVLDEGILISSVVNKLNFVGADVVAVDGSSGCVTIYIPPPEYVSNFGTSDGTTDATIDNVSTSSRHVAAPTSEGNPYNIGTWAGGDTRNTLRNTSIVYSTNEEFALDSVSTSLETTIYDADGTTVLATRTLTTINANSDTTVNDIRIQITDFDTDIDRYKANAIVTFDLSSIIPDGGRFSTEIIHHNDSGDYSKTQNNVFYDPDTVTAALSGVSITEDSVSSSKYLSGIRYYDFGDSFDIGINDIDNINHSSYPTNFIYLDTDNYAITDSNLDGADLTSWNTDYDNTNASYIGNDTIDILNYRAIGSTSIAANAIDWSAGSGVNSPTSLILIDTYVSSSDDDNEDFRDEDRRTSSAFGAWSSTSALASTDLMVQNDRLMVQQGDWTSYGPTNTADYTASGAATQCFFRGLRDDGIAHSNLILRIGGLTEAQLISGDITIEVSLDNSAWLDCTSDWVGTTGTLPDGEPIRINSDTVQLVGGNPGIQITLGSGTGGTTLSGTGPDGWGLYLRICMTSSSTIQLQYIRADW